MGAFRESGDSPWMPSPGLFILLADRCQARVRDRHPDGLRRPRAGSASGAPRVEPDPRRQPRDTPNQALRSVQGLIGPIRRDGTSRQGEPPASRLALRCRGRPE